jgi:hypothetical protein
VEKLIDKQRQLEEVVDNLQRLKSVVDLTDRNSANATHVIETSDEFLKSSQDLNDEVLRTFKNQSEELGKALKQLRKISNEFEQNQVRLIEEVKTTIETNAQNILTYAEGLSSNIKTLEAHVKINKESLNVQKKIIEAQGVEQTEKFSEFKQRYDENRALQSLGNKRIEQLLMIILGLIIIALGIIFFVTY